MSDLGNNDRQTLRGGAAGTSGHPGSGATTGGAAQEARATAGRVRDEAQAVLSDAKAQAAGVAHMAGERAESFAEQQKEAGAKQAEGLARAVHRAADELEGSAPQLAAHVREAGDAAGRLASSLHERSLGSLAGEMQDMARRQPVAFFGAAVLAGFALSRFIKSSAEGVGHAPRGHSGRDAGHGDDARRDGVGRGAGLSTPGTGDGAMARTAPQGAPPSASSPSATRPSAPSHSGMGPSGTTPSGATPMGTQR